MEQECLVLAWVSGRVPGGDKPLVGCFLTEMKFTSHKIRHFRDFPAGPVVKTPQGVQVRSLVGELRSHMPRGVAKKKKKKLAILLFIYLSIWPLRAACGILVPRPGIEPAPSAVKVRNPNQWTAREFPKISHFRVNSGTLYTHSVVQLPPLSKTTFIIPKRKPVPIKDTG